MTDIHKNPKLSVVIPVYNVEPFLHDAMDSIINQKYKKLEIIAINDGSTDGSGDILDSYAEKDNCIQVIHQENAGLSAARNRGLKEASGSYVYFFDSDDILELGAVEVIMKIAIKTDSEIVHFSSLSIDEKGGILKSRRSRKYLQRTPIPGKELLVQLAKTGNYATNVQKYVFSKDFLTHNNLNFDDGYIHEDEAFTLESLCLADRVTSLDEPLMRKRFRSNSIMSNKRGEKNIKGWLRAVLRLQDFINNNQFRNEIVQIIEFKIKKLRLNSLRVVYLLKKTDGVTVRLADYFTEDEIEKLGPYFRYKVKFIRIYFLIYRVQRVFKRMK